MTDQELLDKAAKARGLAHRAQKADYNLGHDGHRTIINHSTSAIDRAHDFAGLMAECRKRGLEMPPCDCPSDAHI